ncbi:FAD-dependent pyridine nucleotide-disulfide oxidoreductase [Ignicoccus islandicus DSM 13165]|uniref:FAD-dependent pyridine nucleotide-disulfide oxidoreductase n=1 Tax=Ignicoccus islandicus DSM 13165 TaxID=940295 RepID=A0A0U3DWC6_9CREN|nr:FAD-dependent oxidoreductase [Ignicoccus islandicus]ALU11786.1 FAD-dependent pyridine nucleotide-disulfide oxidoreductase [Ignicoccus islandicus DSM 13165]
MKEKILILGGGVAGLTFAKELAARGIESTVISLHDYYISGPSRPLVLSGEQQVDRITRGYNFLPKEVKVKYGRVVRVDLDNNKVVLAHGTSEKEVEYEYLAIALGTRYAYDAIKIEDHVFNVYDLGKLFDLKNLIWNATEGTIVVNAPKMPYRCAPAPGETVMTIDMVLRHRGVRDKFKLIFVDANEKPQPAVIADVWLSLFEKAQIEVHLGKEITEVTKEGVVLSDGTEIKADYKVILPPNKPALFENWLEVRGPKDLRLKDYDNVFAIGEVAKLPFPKNAEVTMISARNAAIKLMEMLGVGGGNYIDYKFSGWAYAGNLSGELKTLSVQFSLDFSSGKPVGSKDPEPKYEYTQRKDAWEQGLLKQLFGY